jgi:hypothetical protein
MVRIVLAHRQALPRTADRADLFQLCHVTLHSAKVFLEERL